MSRAVDPTVEHIRGRRVTRGEVLAGPRSEGGVSRVRHPLRRRATVERGVREAIALAHVQRHPLRGGGQRVGDRERREAARGAEGVDAGDQILADAAKDEIVRFSQDVVRIPTLNYGSRPDTGNETPLCEFLRDKLRADGIEELFDQVDCLGVSVGLCECREPGEISEEEGLFARLHFHAPGETPRLNSPERVWAPPGDLVP